MEAIDIAKEMAMYKASIEFLRMEQQRVINLLPNHLGEGVDESLATVKRLIEKAECCLEEALSLINEQSDYATCSVFLLLMIIHVHIPEITVVRIGLTQIRLRFESREIQGESRAEAYHGSQRQQCALTHSRAAAYIWDT